MVANAEYLVSHGKAGDFSRFRAVTPHDYQRGDRVLVRGRQGLEVGLVMCPVNAAHAEFLSDRGQGELLRPFSENDERTLDECRRRSQSIFEDARRLAGEMKAPVEIVDVEVLLDGQQAVIHHLRRESWDSRPFVSTLAKRHQIQPILENLAMPDEPGSGRPGCGQAEGGGCSNCGSGGGCSTGSCSSGTKPE